MTGYSIGNDIWDQNRQFPGWGYFYFGRLDRFATYALQEELGAQPAGWGKFCVLPLPGGVLRVEQPRETLRPLRIAQGGSDRLRKVPLAGREAAL